MLDKKERPLIISSIAGFWNTYMSDSASICMVKHFLKHIDDKETKGVIQYALKLSEQHIKEIEGILNKDKIAIPDAFGEGDVDINVPRLFTDSFYLFYLSTMAGYGMDAYSLMVRNTSRPDVQNFFVKGLNEATDLLIKASDLEKKKGVFLSAPRVEVSPKVTYVEKETFFKGLIGEKRPLIAREITNIFAGLLMDILLRALCAGFGQVTITTEVKDFMFRGRDIASAHFEKFSKLFNDEDIPVPSISDSFVSSSNISPYSDKLMMFQILSITGLLIGIDGIAIASSMRSDLISIHTMFGAEFGRYASEGAQIMINNKWMEQPPQVVRHEDLATV